MIRRRTVLVRLLVIWSRRQVFVAVAAVGACRAMDRGGGAALVMNRTVAQGTQHRLRGGVAGGDQREDGDEATNHVGQHKRAPAGTARIPCIIGGGFSQGQNAKQPAISNNAAAPKTAQRVIRHAPSGAAPECGGGDGVVPPGPWSCPRGSGSRGPGDPRTRP